MELDGRPALDVFSEDIGEELASDLRQVGGLIFAALPVTGSDTADYTVRNLVAIDPASKAIAIAAAVPEGDRVLFCRRDRESAVEDMRRMTGDLKRRVGNRAVRGGIYVSCAARGPNQFASPESETEIIRDALGDFPMIGSSRTGSSTGTGSTPTPGCWRSSSRERSSPSPPPALVRVPAPDPGAREPCARRLRLDHLLPSLGIRGRLRVGQRPLHAPAREGPARALVAADQGRLPRRHRDQHLSHRGELRARLPGRGPARHLHGLLPARRGVLQPLVSAWRYLPAPSFIPLLLMWFGTGDGQKIASSSAG